MFRRLVQNPDGASLYPQPVLAEQGYRLGQQLPLALLHDPTLQDLRSVVGKDLHRFLGDDRSAVALLTDKVDGGTGELNPILQSLFVDVEAIASRPGKGGNEGGVDVENGLGMLLALPADQAGQALDLLKAAGEQAYQVGQVVAGDAGVELV